MAVLLHAHVAARARVEASEVTVCWCTAALGEDATFASRIGEISVCCGFESNPRTCAADDAIVL